MPRRPRYRYSPTLSLTSVLDGVGGQCHTPRAFHPGMTRYPLYRRLGGPHRTGLDRCGKSRPHRDLIPDRSARSESLYRLIIIILTYLLTPWSRVLLEKLTGSVASQEIPRIFGTRKFITAFTSARHLSLS